jgi:hypothetical protein
VGSTRADADGAVISRSTLVANMNIVRARVGKVASKSAYRDVVVAGVDGAIKCSKTNGRVVVAGSVAAEREPANAPDK